LEETFGAFVWLILHK